FERARLLVAGCGALETTLALAEDYAADAKAALAGFDGADGWKAAMIELADFAVWRRM
ncbi:MAG: polyprenyl synthetase family protein, partial [Phenylobacterium sp.]|nr:polyprenyl synthetase family protein [Phenylobacterium sp.]